MARAASSIRRRAFSSDGVRAFVRNRLIEGAGIGLIVLAALLAANLLSFHAADPSWNHAVEAPVDNLFGRTGAILADFILQSLGITAALIVFNLGLWGWRVVKRQPPSRWFLRIPLFLIAITTAAVSLDALPTPDVWPLEIGLGGAVGFVVAQNLHHGLGLAGIPHPEAGVGLIAGLLACACWVVSLGLKGQDWRSLAGGSSKLASDAARFTRKGVSSLAAATLSERREPTLDGSAPGPVAEVVTRRARTPREERPEPVVEPKPTPAKPGRRAQASRQRSLDLGEDGGYAFPPLELLREPTNNPALKALTKDALEQNARLLESVLADFGVQGEIVKVRPGPVVTLYELVPAPGTKTSRVIGLSDDIARSMSAVSVRVAVVPGRNVIGIELPNKNRETVFLQEMLASEAFERQSGRLTLALGKDISGQPFMADLTRMPHLLIAGTTGSGKSVAINTMILSLLYQLKPSECKLILIDPKMLELSVYDGIPHLLSPVVTEPGKAVVALKWAVREMEERYRAMSTLGVRNIAGYNKRIDEALKAGETLTRRVQTGFDPETGKPIFEDQPLPSEPLPFIVVIVDEMADLMLVAGKDIEAAVQRLAQMARAAGIHIIMATQRPSVDVITGTIKANFPTRISFQVTSKIDSRTILGEPGAEQLLGQGDMLYMAGGGRITRIHGPFVTDEEVEDVVRCLRDQGEPEYLEAVTEEEDADEEPFGIDTDRQSGDPLYDEAVALVAREGKASTSFIQRHLQIGYNRAARIIEQMEGDGIVSKANRVGRREVLIGNGSDDSY